MQNVQECWACEDALCNDVGVQMMSHGLKLKMLQCYRKDINMSTTTSDAEHENDTNDQP